MGLGITRSPGFLTDRLRCAARLPAVLAFAFLLSSPAAAGTLYRCISGDGGVTYSSSRVLGQACKNIHYAGGGHSRRGSMAAWSPSSATGSTSGVGAPLAPGLPASATLSTMPPHMDVQVPRAQDAQERPPIVPMAMGSNGPARASGSVAGHAPVNSPRVDFRTAPSVSQLSAPRYASGARVTRGAVYKFTHDGVTNYTNLRPSGSVGATVLFTYIETCFACGVRPGVNFATLALNTQAFANEIATASRNYGVDESLVRAIIHAESAFNPNALSYKGAQGLMQLMPDTARRFGVGNTFSAVDNISGGVQYLSFLSKRFNGDVRLIAAAYNAGEGAVDRYGGVPPYAETQRYVERVGTLAERYRTISK